MTIVHRETAQQAPRPVAAARPPFPFTALVGQQDMCLAMLLTAIVELSGPARSLWAVFTRQLAATL